MQVEKNAQMASELLKQLSSDFGQTLIFFCFWFIVFLFIVASNLIRTIQSQQIQRCHKTANEFKKF